MAAESLQGTLDDLPVTEPFEVLRRRTIESARMTVNEYSFEAGARFPTHHHPEEQVTIVLEGSVELTVEGETAMLPAGGWSVVAGDVKHGIRAGAEGARIVAIISPRRKRADAYTVVS
jgi:quercetin dioxygenase-like cupin family protein